MTSHPAADRSPDPVTDADGAPAGTAQPVLAPALSDDDSEAALRALLGPHEVLRAYGEASIAFGSEGRAADQEPLDLSVGPRAERFWDRMTRTRLRKVLFFTVLSPLLLVALVEGIGTSIGDGVDRVVFGAVCRGPRGSLARRVEHALRSLGGGGADTFVLTSSRLLLVHVGVGSASSPRPVFDVPLDAIASARPAPRGPLRRRLELRFGDGSSIVLALPSFRSPAPRTVVPLLSPRS